MVCRHLEGMQGKTATATATLVPAVVEMPDETVIAAVVVVEADGETAP